MNSTEHIHDSLYEIPNCTICLNELSEDLTNLNCGHVFHMTCITQHFQYRPTCPNCQKRSHQKEIRIVVYPLTKNNQSAMALRQMVGNLSSNQKDQVQVLFKELQSANQGKQKILQKLIFAEKDSKKAQKQLNQTKTSLNSAKSQIDTLKRDTLELKKVIEHLHNQIRSINEQNFNLRTELLNYKQKQSEYNKIKKLKSIMTQKSQDLINYKNQLESKKTSPQQKAKLFFDMALLKNLEVLKCKQTFQDYPQKFMQKQAQINKLKLMFEKQRKQLNEVYEKRSIQRKKHEEHKAKHEELKAKYRNLIEKYKAKCYQNSLEDDLNQDSKLSIPSYSIIQPLPFKLKSSLQSKKEDSVPSNVPKQKTKSTIDKHVPFKLSNSIMEQEHTKQSSESQQVKKITTQVTLSSFINPSKSSASGFGSFGGIVAKKNEKNSGEKKTSMKNIFS